MANIGTFRSFDGEVLEYAYRKGRKPVIVFLPALGFDWTYWKRSLDYFSGKGHGVLALTLRGHSRHRAKMKCISMDDHLQDLKLFLAELKIKNPIVVGASLGGAMAAAYCAGNGGADCICINAPFDTKRQLRPTIKLLAFLCRPITWLDWIARDKLILTSAIDIDFSRSILTNNILMMLKALLKFNSRGLWLNYDCLRNSAPVRRGGCITINSSKDEVLSHTAKSDYAVNGNHHCVISSSDQINKLLERIISARR